MDASTPGGPSRRRILLGIGTVGVVAAGAGLGSLGSLRDTERVRNTVAAGALDLAVAYRTTYNGETLTDVPGGDVDCDTPGLVDGDGVPVLELEDLKPGDDGSIGADLHVCTNPARLWLSATLVAAPEHALRPEEVAAGDATPEIGELGDLVEVTCWVDTDRDGVVDHDEHLLYEGTLTGLTRDLASGVAVAVDEAGDPSCVERADGPVPVALSWRLPLDGPNHNRAITDAVRFDLRFAAVQCRHDPVGANPFEGAQSPEDTPGTEADPGE
jgi:hypothetical protein